MPDVLLEGLQLHLQRATELGVEGAERLVEQQDGRVEHQGTGERHPLLLAAGELAGPPLAVALELHQLQGRTHPLGPSRPW